jgi:hypothetical protein
VLMFAVFFWSFFTLMTPLYAKFGFFAVLFGRVLIGSFW